MLSNGFVDCGEGEEQGSQDDLLLVSSLFE
jgi:hypothetical protein